MFAPPTDRGSPILSHKRLVMTGRNQSNRCLSGISIGLAMRWPRTPAGRKTVAPAA
jgi:hypothetical protein